MKENKVIWRMYMPLLSHLHPVLSTNRREVKTMQTEKTKLLELVSALNEA